MGKQDLSERNLIKVSLDYYIQGFCLSSLTLRPSAFYGAAGARTGALRASLWRNVLLNQSATATMAAAATATPAGVSPQQLARCRAEVDVLGRKPKRAPQLDACQDALCGISQCNLLQ